MFINHLNKKNVIVCKVCNKKGHNPDKCWYVSGQFPKWHAKSGKQVQSGPQKEQGRTTAAK